MLVGLVCFGQWTSFYVSFRCVYFSTPFFSRCVGKLFPSFQYPQGLHKMLGRPKKSHWTQRRSCHILSRYLPWKRIVIVGLLDILCKIKKKKNLTQNDLQSEVLIQSRLKFLKQIYMAKQKTHDSYVRNLYKCSQGALKDTECLWRKSRPSHIFKNLFRQHDPFLMTAQKIVLSYFQHKKIC